MFLTEICCKNWQIFFSCLFHSFFLQNLPVLSRILTWVCIVWHDLQGWLLLYWRVFPWTELLYFRNCMIFVMVKRPVNLKPTEFSLSVGQSKDILNSTLKRSLQRCLLWVCLLIKTFIVSYCWDFKKKPCRHCGKAECLLATQNTYQKMLIM